MEEKGVRTVVNFKYSEKVIKFEIKSRNHFDLVTSRKWGIFSIFCCLLRISELFRSMHNVKNQQYSFWFEYEGTNSEFSFADSFQ